MRCRDRFCREADGCSFRTKRWGAGEQRFCSGKKRRRSKSFQEGRRAARRAAPTASPAQWVAVGEEEPGSGRMTSFCAAGIKRRRSKADFAPTWCKRGDSNSHGGCHTHLKRACLPIPTLLHFPYGEVIIADEKEFVNRFFPVFGLGRGSANQGPGPWWRRTICS